MISRRENPDRFMDHRWGHRVRADIDIQVICLPYVIGTGRLIDMSVSGAFVRTALLAPRLARIHVLGSLGVEGGVAPCRIEAHVVRYSRKGLGVEWSEFAPPAICQFLSARLERQPDPYLSKRLYSF